MVDKETGDKMKAFDLLLKGGHVIDPLNGVNRVTDLAISLGKVAAIEEDIQETKSKKVVNVSGLYITPGLVDIHCHLYGTTGMPNAWAGDWSVMPDCFSFRSGVTAMVDAGSSGWRNFEDFRYRVIERARTHIFAFINVAGLGMLTDVSEQNVCDLNPEPVLEVIEKHKDVIVGVKTAHYRACDWTAVDKAIKAGTIADIPTMVDFGYFRAERPYYRLVSERLRPGDISTHMYAAPVPYVAEDGGLLCYLKQARARGVKFDVGHGGGSFVFRNAVPSIRQGFFPDTISSDLHALSMNFSMIDLPTVMSKFLAMGMTLPEVIRSTTSTPAQLINRGGLGHLSLGSVADIAIFKLHKGEFGFSDTAGGKITGERRLQCVMTIKDGNIKWDWDSRAATNFELLGSSYGIRDVDRIIMPSNTKQ